jgi:hypothetical protein
VKSPSLLLQVIAVVSSVFLTGVLIFYQIGAFDTLLSPQVTAAEPERAVQEEHDPQPHEETHYTQPERKSEEPSSVPQSVASSSQPPAASKEDAPEAAKSPKGFMGGSKSAPVFAKPSSRWIIPPAATQRSE